MSYSFYYAYWYNNKGKFFLLVSRI